MVDEVRQRLARGMERIDAVGDATRRLAAPLLASTVTTALSFTPMILLPGPAGDFVGAIAIAVVLMLIWSLFVAVTVTPAPRRTFHETWDGQRPVHPRAGAARFKRPFNGPSPTR